MATTADIPRLEMLQVARLACKALGDSAELTRRFLFAQLDEDGRSGRGLVAQDAPAGPPGELRNDLGREAPRKGREPALQHDAADLPVAGRAVLPRAGGLRGAERCGRHRRGREPGERRAVPDAQPLEARQVDAARGAEDVAQGVAPRVAVGAGVVRRSDSQPVEHHDRRAAGHLSARCPARSGIGAPSAPGRAAAPRRDRAVPRSWPPASPGYR